MARRTNRTTSRPSHASHQSQSSQPSRSRLGAALDGLLLGLIALVLLAHSLQAHKEYRFVFAVIPLWLLIGADLVVRVQRWISARRASGPHAARWTIGSAAALFAAASLTGVLNALPYQERVYQAWSQHRAIPFYGASTGQAVSRDLATLSASVSHLVSADPDLTVPGYSLERGFGDVRILRRAAVEPPVRRWQEYAPVIVGDLVHRIMLRVDAEAPPPPAGAGIIFAAPP